MKAKEVDYAFVEVPFKRANEPICPKCGHNRIRIVYVDDEMTEVAFYDCTWCSHHWKPKRKRKKPQRNPRIRRDYRESEGEVNEV